VSRSLAASGRRDHGRDRDWPTSKNSATISALAGSMSCRARVICQLRDVLGLLVLGTDPTVESEPHLAHERTASSSRGYEAPGCSSRAAFWRRVRRAAASGRSRTGSGGATNLMSAPLRSACSRELDGLPMPVSSGTTLSTESQKRSGPGYTGAGARELGQWADDRGPEWCCQHVRHGCVGACGGALLHVRQPCLG